MDILITIIAFILIFGLLIFVHEFGHFITAKRAGVKVEEFAFGLPILPRIFKLKRGETTYSIYPVPFGGFVRMLGEDGEDLKKGARPDPRSFAAKPARTRAKILVAGVVMNLLLAFVLLTIGFLFKMPPLALCASSYPGATFENSVTVGALSDSGAAKAAGLQVGDTIKSIDNQALRCSRDVPRLVSDRQNEPLQFAIERSGAPQNLTITPKSEAGVGKVGVAPQDNYQNLDYPMYTAPLIAGIETVTIVKETFNALGGIFVSLFSAGGVPEGVAGPVGIAKITGEVVGLGALIILRFVAILSISLAVFNILPIPALDGGRLLFIGIEKLRGGRPVTPRIESAIHAGGFAVLILFILVITYFDIT